MAVIPSGSFALPSRTYGLRSGAALLTSLLLALCAVVCGPANAARAAAGAARCGSSRGCALPAGETTTGETATGDNASFLRLVAAADLPAADLPAADLPADDAGATAGQDAPPAAGGSGPAAADDEAQGGRYGSVVLPILDNDTAGSGCTWDPSSVGLLRPADASGVGGTTDLILPGEGIWSVNSDGSLAFTPNPDFGGWSSWVGYSVQDSCGNAAQARARAYLPAATATAGATEDAGVGGLGGSGNGDHLASTGTEFGGLLVIAFALVLGGGLLVLLPKRRRRKEDSAAA